MLNKFKVLIQRAGFSGKDIVLSVPSYYTEQERLALLDAAKIAVSIVLIIRKSTF